ncbi:hypothetical protein [Nocardiopsis ansamitocini]|uniref:hypothetical protein n=1 Tax=Nocardiopsis ansamitocini TaxID=1670832 RepID=UPI0025548733|nr:hypothetical protein [Nocardiopsis ansamitocini]
MNERIECGPHPVGTHPVPMDGRRHLGRLETVLHRRWPAGTIPSPQVIAHIDTLASLPSPLVERIITEVDDIFIGEGSVVDLAGYGHLRGVSTDPTDPDALTYDRLAGIYRFGVLLLGTLPNASTSLVLHEVAHVLDLADLMMSETRHWRELHASCLPHLDNPYWHARHEWWAECFAYVAQRDMEGLAKMLAGDEQLAYAVFAYFQENYGVIR